MMVEPRFFLKNFMRRWQFCDASFSMAVVFNVVVWLVVQLKK